MLIQFVTHSRIFKLKETVSRDFCQFFLALKIRSRPIRTGKNGFATFFVFVKIFDPKDQKSSVSVVNDYGLCGHDVGVVNNYADTQFSKISNYIFVTFLLFPK